VSTAGVTTRPGRAEATIMLPTPSRAAYLTLVVALLVAGMFAGTFLHAQIFGLSWDHAHTACYTKLGLIPRDPAGFQNYAREWGLCIAPSERREGLMGVAGAVAALVLATGFMLLLATRAARRGRPALAPDALQRRAARLGTAVGLSRVPRIAIGSARVRDPYTAGRPGHPTVLLPAGLIGRPDDEIDAALLHELAHVSGGDVTLVWFTRGVWWAILPVLSGPLMVLGYQEGRSRNPHWASTFTVTTDYLGRAVVLLAITAILSYSVLRSREHEADLRVAQAGLAGPLTRLLVVKAAPRRWWSRPFATHPLPSRRTEILRRRDLLSPPRKLDIFCLAILLGTTWWTILTLCQELFTGTRLAGTGSLAAGLVTGALLAGTLGLALWRQALAGLAWPLRARLELLAVFALGAIAGQVAAVSLTASGDWAGPWQHPATLFFPVLLLIAAIGLSQVLARFWATLPRSWFSYRGLQLMIFLTNLVVFTGATWYGQNAQVLDRLGWLTTLVWAPAERPAPVALATLITAMLLTLTALRRPHPQTVQPVSLRKRLLVPVVCILATCASAVLTRLLIGTPPTASPGQEVSLDCWVAAVAGAGCLIAALLIRGNDGLVAAYATGSAATLITSVALFLLADETQGRPFLHPVAAASLYLKQSLSIFALFLFVVGVLSLADPPRSGRLGSHWLTWALPGAGALIGAGLTFAVLRSGTTLLLN